MVSNTSEKSAVFASPCDFCLEILDSKAPATRINKPGNIHGSALLQATQLLRAFCSANKQADFFPSIDLRNNSLTAAALGNQLSLLTKYKNCRIAIKCVNKAETTYWLSDTHLLRRQSPKDGMVFFLRLSQRKHKIRAQKPQKMLQQAEIKRLLFKNHQRGITALHFPCILMTIIYTVLDPKIRDGLV